MEKNIKEAVTKQSYEYLARTFGAVLLEEENAYSYVKGNEVLLCCFVFPDQQLRRKAIGSAYGIDFPKVKLMFIMDSGTGEIFARACDGELRGITYESLMEITKAPDWWID